MKTRIQNKYDVLEHDYSIRSCGNKEQHGMYQAQQAAFSGANVLVNASLYILVGKSLTNDGDNFMSYTHNVSTNITLLYPLAFTVGNCLVLQ